MSTLYSLSILQLQDALRTKPQPKISNHGLVRSINNTSRLVLDSLVKRKASNPAEDHIKSVLSDITMRQWNSITVWSTARYNIL